MPSIEDPQTMSVADHNLSLQLVTISTEFRLFREEMRDKLKPLESLDARLKLVENELQMVNLVTLRKEHNEMYDRLKASSWSRTSLNGKLNVWGGIAVTIAAIAEVIYYASGLHK